VPEWSFWFGITVYDGGGAAEVYLEKNAQPPLLSGQRVYVSGRRGRGAGRAGLTTGGRGQAWAAPPGGEPSSLPLFVSSSSSVGLLVK
jgi:hypothetical protein